MNVRKMWQFSRLPQTMRLCGWIGKMKDDLKKTGMESNDRSLVAWRTR